MKPSRKTFVLDTSVLMSDPQCFTAYAGSRLVIPLTVVDELDGNANRDDAPGACARSMLRLLETLRKNNGGDLSKDVPYGEEGTSVRVELNGVTSGGRGHLNSAVPDHRIISAALSLADAGDNVTLVSNDAAMRLKAAALGLTACEHEREPEIPDTGVYTIQTTKDVIDAVYAGESLDEYDLSFPVNSFVILKAGSSSAVTRQTSSTLRLLPSGESRQVEAWGLRGRSKEQAFALDLLHDDTVPLVALLGAAGTGKTILAIAAGLQQVFETQEYDRLMILRPVISVGRQDLGFLPGELQDKLGPWFETVIDTMVALSGTGRTHAQCRAQLDLWMSTGQVVTEPVTFMRGRSLQRTFVIVDECQNLETSVVKTLVTRLGESSKGVFIGDESQVDNPWTTPTSNGLTSVVSAFAGCAEFGYVRLIRGERSLIATMAAERM
jgi:PhoH-like ATPase